MKKLTISLIIVLTAMTSLAQTQVKKNEVTSNGNSQRDQNCDIIIYRLFQTQNMWTFIKLNTRNGQMWQVQYDIKENNRLETYLNLIPLVAKEDEKMAGLPFTLLKTSTISCYLTNLMAEYGKFNGQ